jgi:O-antigen/teichoic acid export membrane protein
VVLGFGGMLMVVAPVLGWVLVPLLSRAVQRGPEEAGAIVRRAIETCVVLGAPLSIIAFIAADELMAPPFYTEAFAPAALVLRIMAPTYLLTYLNVVCANCLAAIGRGWTVTALSLTTLLLTPVLDFFLIPLGLHHLGPAGGAAACSAAVVTVELLTTGLMLWQLGGLAFDARLRSVVLRTALTAVSVVALDQLLRAQHLAAWPRVGLGALAYVALALLTRSVRVSDAVAFVRLARAERAAQAAAAT